MSEFEIGRWYKAQNGDKYKARELAYVGFGASTNKVVIFEDERKFPHVLPWEDQHLWKLELCNPPVNWPKLWNRYYNALKNPGLLDVDFQKQERVLKRLNKSRIDRIAKAKHEPSR